MSYDILNCQLCINTMMCFGPFYIDYCYIIGYDYTSCIYISSSLVEVEINLDASSINQ